MIPAPDHRLAVRIAELEARVAELDRLLQRAGRPMRRTQARDVRLARTIKDPVSGTYPTTGETFWIEFLDSYFTATAGSSPATHATRKTNVVAHNLRGAFLPEGTVVEAMWQRGLAGGDKGQWWIDLIGGTVPAKCTADITARASTTPGSGTVDLHHLAGGVLTSLGVTLTVYSEFKVIVPNGTWVHIGQDVEGTWWLIAADCP